MVLGISNNALASVTVQYQSATHATFLTTADQTSWGYLENGSYTMYGGYHGTGETVTLSSATVPMLSDNATMPLRVYEFDSACFNSGHVTNTADPDFCGTLVATVPANNGLFTNYVDTTPHLGIGMFKTGVGAYTSTDMIGQTASAVQSTLGENGLGTILAVIGGLMVAFGVILWIVATFKEASDDKKKRKI